MKQMQLLRVMLSLMNNFYPRARVDPLIRSKFKLLHPETEQLYSIYESHSRQSEFVIKDHICQQTLPIFSEFFLLVLH